MKQRHTRPSGELSDDTVIVVRGGPLLRERLDADAVRAFNTYGVYAISVFAADGVTVDDLATVPPLVRFELLTLMTAGAVRAAGFRLVPTGRQRLHHGIEFDDLKSGVASLMRCEHRTQNNPYHVE